MVARIPNLELLLYKAQQALAHDPDFVQKIAEIKENDSRKKVYLDFSVECFSQIWGSTCTGFDVTEAGEPVMAGSAMTEEYTTIVHEKTTDTYCVFFGDRPCYKVDNPSNEFYEDMMKEHIHMRELYEMDDTYPERYKLKELCKVDVEALNNEFKEVIQNV